jgi:hypothetical protein
MMGRWVDKEIGRVRCLPPAAHIEHRDQSVSRRQEAVENKSDKSSAKENTSSIFTRSVLLPTA